MSRDEFKPKPDPNKWRGTPLARPEFAVRAPLLMEDDDEPIVVQPPTRTQIRRRRHVESPNETSLAQEALDAANMLGAGLDSEAILDTIEEHPIIASAFTPLGAFAGARYNPRALGSAFTDAVTFGNAAELAALADRVGDDADYDTALQRREMENATEYARNPGSAIAGGVAGLVNASALPLRGAPGTGSLALRAARTVAPAVAGGAVLGGIGGAIAAPDDQRLAGAGRGALRGAGTMGTAAALGGVADRLRAAELPMGLPYLASLGARGALTGGEMGVLATPGTTPNAGLSDYAQNAGMGAVVGIPMEFGMAGLGGAARMLGRRNAPRRVIPEATGPAPDESTLLMDESELGELIPNEAQAPSPLRRPEEIVDAARANSTDSALGEAARSLVESDPAHERLFSLTATGPGMRAAERQGAASFGSIQGLMDELQRIGIAREHSVYSRTSERARALEAQAGIMRELQRANEQIAARGGRVNAAEVADAIDDAADVFLARAPENADRIAAADQARAYARRLRGDAEEIFGSFVPVEETAPGEYAPTGEEPIVSDMQAWDRTLTHPELRSRMSEEWNAGVAGRQAARVAGAQPPQMRVAPMIYQAMRPFRERLAQEALPAADYAAQQANQRASLALNAINPPELRLDINANAQPANLRGNLARMAEMSSGGEGRGPGERLVGGFLAQMRENLIANYQHSLRAAANELMRAAPIHSVFAEGVPRLTAPIVEGAGVGTDAALRAAAAEQMQAAPSLDPEAAMEREQQWEESLDNVLPEPTTPEEEEAQERFHQWEEENMR